MPGAQKIIRFTAQADLLAALDDWRRWLITERRTSVHTVDGYCRDIAAFLNFLNDYRGETPNISVLADLKPADFRAWLAARLQYAVEIGSCATTEREKIWVQLHIASLKLAILLLLKHREVGATANRLNACPVPTGTGSKLCSLMSK